MEECVARWHIYLHTLGLFERMANIVWLYALANSTQPFHLAAIVRGPEAGRAVLPRIGSG